MTWIYNKYKSVQDNCADFEQAVYGEILERIEVSFDKEDINYSQMEIIDTAINKDWFPEIAPVTYARVAETIYTWCHKEDGELICEELQMWN